MDGQTWRWFTVRLFGLPADARLWRALRPASGEEDDSTDSIDAVLDITRE